MLQRWREAEQIPSKPRQQLRLVVENTAIRPVAPDVALRWSNFACFVLVVVMSIALWALIGLGLRALVAALP